MEQSPDQEHAFVQLGSQVSRSAQRLARLESDATEAEVGVKESSVRQDDAYAALGREFSLVRGEIDKLRVSIAEFTKRSGRVMLRFRELVKKDQVEEVGRRLDGWPLESFVTRGSFSALLERRLTRRP